MDRVKRSGKASPLLIAVGPKDKENVANPQVLLNLKSATGGIKKKGLKLHSKTANRNIEMIRNQINNLQNDKKKTITAEDLTTNGNPGEAYWEQLSESRRVALEATWKENMDLHSKVMELEYENTKLKAMLAEATNSIQLLTELLEDRENEDDEESDEEADSEPDDNLDDASFTSV